MRPIRQSPILKALGIFQKEDSQAKALAEALAQAEERHRETAARMELLEEVNDRLMGDRLAESAKTGWAFISGGNRRSHDRGAGWVNRHQMEAHRLIQAHPLADRAMDIRSSFICQQGFKLESDCDDPTVQAFLDRHWRINWEKNYKKRSKSLCAYGELAYYIPPANIWNGHYELSSIGRDLIDSIQPAPANAERAGSLRLNEELTISDPFSGTKFRRDEFEIVHYNWLTNRYEGEVLYLGVNTLDTQLRGLSDLGPVMDWLDGFDTLTWQELERVKALRAFVWWLKKQGATPSQIAAETKKWASRPFRSGMTFVSDEKVELSAVSPDLNTGEALTFLEFLFKVIWGGLRLPEHWYYTAGDVNRASAGEMGDPVYASIRDRKGEFADLLVMDAQIAVERASQVPGHKLFNLAQKHPECLGVKITSRDPEQNAFDVIGTALKTFGEAMLLGETSGWISKQQAGKQFREAASQRGLGEIPAPEDENLSPEAMHNQALEQLDRRRPDLQKIYPLVPTGATMQVRKDGTPTGHWSIPSDTALAS